MSMLLLLLLLLLPGANATRIVSYFAGNLRGNITLVLMFPMLLLLLLLVPGGVYSKRNAHCQLLCWQPARQHHAATDVSYDAAAAAAARRCSQRMQRALSAPLLATCAATSRWY
jgi:hypothetical protein